MYQLVLEDLNADSNAKYVRRISYQEAKPFLLGIHYARRMPSISFAFGLFLGGGGQVNRCGYLRCSGKQ